MAGLRWLFGGRAQPDGGSAAIEALVTGVSPAMLAAATELRPLSAMDPAVMLASPVSLPSGGDLHEVPSAMQGRRDRVLAGGKQMLIDSLAAKVLHGWLQNRHQTLFPLTVNLRSLKPGQAEVLAEWMAVAALATRPSEDHDGAGLRDWLGSVGADAASLAALERALASPPPLDRALSAITRHGLGAYAYVAALMATDQREPATAPFLDYVAARLALPTTVVRSAVRRYRH